MGINLNNHVKDANHLFTYEEAEKLFVTAGYTTSLPTTKDYSWEISGSPYVVKNVPFILLDTFEGEEYFDSNVSINLAAIREMMIEGIIPPTVDYNRISHIRF